MTAINEERARLLSQNERQATENDEQSFTSTPFGTKSSLLKTKVM